jgi:imidazolonepropionase
MPDIYRLIEHATLLTADPNRATVDDPLGMIFDGAVLFNDEHIVWVGRSGQHPPQYQLMERIDAQQMLVTPALIDCHTHLPFAGDRSNEFAQRARGESYLAIAAAGGGIAATVGATTALTDDVFIALIIERAQALLATGIATIECKSGYELTIDGELRVLRCIAKAQQRLAVTLVPTLLLHVPPASCSNDAAARTVWLHDVCTKLITTVAIEQLATSVDVYCDIGAYTLAESIAIWQAAQQAGLAIRGHVGQFSDTGATAWLAAHNALSVDHLEFVSSTDMTVIAAAGTIAVMIPTACVQLSQVPPPVAQLRAHGVKMAIASDLNPGTSHCIGLAVPMWLAATHYGMTVEETWLGVTRHAATAIRRPDIGQIAIGCKSAIARWKVLHAAAVCSVIGENQNVSVHC